MFPDLSIYKTTPTRTSPHGWQWATCPGTTSRHCPWIFWVWFSVSTSRWQTAISTTFWVATSWIDKCDLSIFKTSNIVKLARCQLFPFPIYLMMRRTQSSWSFMLGRIKQLLRAFRVCFILTLTCCLRMGFSTRPVRIFLVRTTTYLVQLRVTIHSGWAFWILYHHSNPKWPPG